MLVDNMAVIAAVGSMIVDEAEKPVDREKECYIHVYIFIFYFRHALYSSAYFATPDVTTTSWTTTEATSQPMNFKFILGA
uniref:Uncharacterized protein n=1 Tax=Timema genevievae TaxID=629358 RepID=A0A7R9PIM6_TIMGE|nr:unnamed protein product [Timema genevievae]